MAQWSTLMPCNREAAGSNLWGFGFILKSAHYEVDYSGKKTFLAGLQGTLTPSCAKSTGNYETSEKTCWIHLVLSKFHAEPSAKPNVLVQITQKRCRIHNRR